MRVRHPLEQEKQWLIVEATEHDVSLLDIHRAANNALEADPAMSPAERTFALLRWALRRGFVGFDMVDGKPVPWRDQSPGHVVSVIREAWRKAGMDERGMDEIGWQFWFYLRCERDA